MPATQSERREIREDAEFDVMNLLLSSLTEMADWPEPTRQWIGLGSDLENERLKRADTSNYQMSFIENEILYAQEAIFRHSVRYYGTSGREAEYHLKAIEDYRTHIKRLQKAMHGILRQAGIVWPFPKMMRAALSSRRSDGNRSIIPPAQLRQLKGLLNQKLAQKDGAPPPPPGSEESDADEEPDEDDEAEE